MPERTTVGKAPLSARWIVVLSPETRARRSLAGVRS